MLNAQLGLAFSASIEFRSQCPQSLLLFLSKCVEFCTYFSKHGRTCSAGRRCLTATVRYQFNGMIFGRGSIAGIRLVNSCFCEERLVHVTLLNYPLDHLFIPLTLFSHFCELRHCRLQCLLSMNLCLTLKLRRGILFLCAQPSHHSQQACIFLLKLLNIIELNEILRDYMTCGEITAVLRCRCR